MAEKSVKNSNGYEFKKNENFDTSYKSFQQFTDPVRSDHTILGDYTTSCSTSRKSSVDSSVVDSDWSDTSFYALPSYQKVNRSAFDGQQPQIDRSASHYQGSKSHVYPEVKVQQNVTITNQSHLQFFTKPTNKHSTNFSKPQYQQRPFRAMDRPLYNYNGQASPDSSDDTLAQSSSGIAFDLDSPRSLRSILVETPRGLASSFLQERQFNSHKEPVGARSLPLTRNKAVVAPLSRSIHQVQSNVEADGLLQTMNHTGRPQMRNAYNTGNPNISNGNCSEMTHRANGHHVRTPKLDFQSYTGISDNSEERSHSILSRESGTGTPTQNGYNTSGIPYTNRINGSTWTTQTNGINGESLHGLYSTTVNSQTNVVPIKYHTTGIPNTNGMSYKTIRHGNTGNPQPNGVKSESVLNTYSTTGSPQNNGSMNVYNDTGILKHYDKIAVKNLIDEDVSSRLVLNNGIRSSELENTWNKRKMFGMSKDWKHTSLLDQYSIESSRHITPSVWAMKLLEQERTPSPSPELILKARLFRRWHQRARLQRLDRMESENKMNKAVEFWRNITFQKHFAAWRRSKMELETKADQVYRKHMLVTGFKGLKFAVQVNTQASGDVKKRVDSRLMAKYWLKWQSQYERKKSENLRSAFHRWRVVHLEGNRDKILEGIADKHFMTRSYFKWKMRYTVEQSNSVANLNFQITLITKCWHSWRIYTAQRIVKTRTNEVARIHYENTLQAHVFKVWIERRKRCSIASSLLKRRILVKAFYSWKNWTKYAKVIHQRFQSMCKEYYSRALLKQSFTKWKQKLLLQQAINYHSNLLQKRVYRLWFLRYRRNVLHRHLCKAMAKKGKKRRFFRIWLSATISQREKRKAFVTRLQKVLLSRMMVIWKNHTYERLSLKQKFTWVTKKKDFNRTRAALDQWLFAMKVANFKKQTRVNWTNRCVRNACAEWKLMIKRKYLEETLIETRPARDLWLLKSFWNTWRQRKEALDREKEHVNSVITILQRNFKRRIFMAWRVTNQQEQIIAPMVARRERKQIAKVFDAWRLHIYRQKYIIDQHTRAEEKVLDKHFLYWRERAFLQIKGRDAVTKLQHSKMSRAFAAWRGYIRDIRHDRLKERAKKLQLMSFYFKKWTERREAQMEAREQQRGQQIRKELLLRWVFRYWQQSADSKRESLLQIEEQVKVNIRLIQLRRCMDVWVRWYRVAEIVRDHLASRQEQLMRKVFQAWGAVIKEEINSQMNRFTINLALDSSMGSNLGCNLGTSQTLRSTLDSNGGSFLRSTLDSTGGNLLRSTLDSNGGNLLRSTLNSTLSESLSSGYWTNRRGSGSVFPVRTAGASARDDDIASLPGRMDQFHPDSPRFRSVSPITLIRESNNITHVTTPLAAVQSPTSSPSPSPPEFHLSLPSSTDYTDCVFLPVKERGSSMMSRSDRSELLERRQSSMDDEEFDSMSMTSGMSTASVRDKEMVLIDTLLHWRSLPLSKTFRTWLKYTRQKKLLRELLYYAKEKKANEILGNIFQQWRRKLYVTVTCRQHWLNSTRSRCLRAWRSYVEHRQLREKSFQEADTLNRTSLLTRFFNTWRSKYTAKMRLQNIVGQWQKKAIVAEKHKAIEEKVQSHHSQRMLKETFQYWIMMTKKSQEAKQFYMERLLPRTFLGWHQYSCTHANNCKKSTWFKDHRVLSVSFTEWRKRFLAQQMAHDYLEAKELELSVSIMKTWHQWASGVCARRRLWRSYHKSLQLKTMKNIFTEWLNQVKRREAAEMMYKQSMMRSVLLSWQNVCKTVKEDREKAATVKKTCSDGLLRQSFTFWHRLFIHSQQATNLSQQRDQMLIKECFQDWREHTLSTKADKHHVNWNLKKVYYKWYDKFLARKRARHMIKAWKIIAEDSRTLNSKAMKICQQTEKKILRQTFMFWMLETHKIQKAKHHYSVTTCRSSLMAWFDYAHTKVRCRTVLSQAKAAKNKALLIEAFSLWRDSFVHQLLNQEKLDDYLQTKELHQLQTCMLTWRKYTMKCRAHKYHDNRLLCKSFYDWRLRLSQKRGLEKVVEKVFYRRLRQAAMHWRQWTKKTKHQQTQADEFQIVVGNRITRNCFAYWIAATEKSHRAKEKHDKSVLKRALINWRIVVNKQIQENKTIQQFQQEMMNKKVVMMFQEWQSSFQQAQKYNKLVNSQLQKHHTLMLNGCLKQWKKHHVKCRADKHYNVVLVARFFLEWKTSYDERMLEKDREQVLEERAIKHYNRRLSRLCFRSWHHDVRVEKYLEMKQQQLVEKHFRLWQKKANLKTIASQLGDQQTYAKYWSKWRNQLVRKRVSELMMKHEEKKLLSEVFGAWYKVTMIERRLLNEWNIAVTEKWFRRWMQKYNES